MCPSIQSLTTTRLVTTLKCILPEANTDKNTSNHDTNHHNNSAWLVTNPAMLVTPSLALVLASLTSCIAPPLHSLYSRGQVRQRPVQLFMVRSPSNYSPQTLTFIAFLHILHLQLFSHNLVYILSCFFIIFVSSSLLSHLLISAFFFTLLSIILGISDLSDTSMQEKL